jgi:hypothetical protein
MRFIIKKEVIPQELIDKIKKPKRLIKAMM